MSLFANKTAVAVLTDRLREISDDVRELKSAHKHLELEWEELYDKVRHQMARMSRRVKADPPEELNADEVPVVDQPFPDTDSISRSILLRRGHHGAKL